VDVDQISHGRYRLRCEPLSALRAALPHPTFAHLRRTTAFHSHPELETRQPQHPQVYDARQAPELGVGELNMRGWSDTQLVIRIEAVRRELPLQQATPADPASGGVG